VTSRLCLNARKGCTNLWYKRFRVQDKWVISAIFKKYLQCVLAARILTADFVVCTLAVKKNQGRIRHVGSDHSLVSPTVLPGIHCSVLLIDSLCLLQSFHPVLLFQVSLLFSKYMADRIICISKFKSNLHKLFPSYSINLDPVQEVFASFHIRRLFVMSFKRINVASEMLWFCTKYCVLYEQQVFWCGYTCKHWLT
jgi:hypothetical protein